MLKRLIASFALLIYIVIPFIDSSLCGDCRGGASFQGEAEISYLSLPHANVSFSAIDANDYNQAPIGKDAKVPCSICFNSVAGISFHNFKALIQTVPFTDRIKVNVFLEPAFSINKPPQN